ncbi:MAG TPA: tripartite tricarboxylate transporter TctB family protein [Burkholderiales bacterium]|nr:tripartite tricarboxylate transporter TctB family protein [Burkholderiales bacterium]
MHLHRDILAALLFIAIGAFALYGARGYPVGTAMQMGPGYFPVALGWLLILLGALVGVRAARARDWQPLAWDWRPLAWISVSILAFGFLMPRFGLVPALLAMFPLAAAAGRQSRWHEVVVLTLVMSGFAAAVFVYGLKLPYRLVAF